MAQRSLRGFIASFQRQIRPLSAGDVVDVARVVEVADRARDTALLREGLASLLARDAEERRRIGELVDQQLRGELDDEGRVHVVGSDGHPGWLVWRWLAAAFVVVGVGVGWWWWRAPQPDEALEAPVAVTPAGQGVADPKEVKSPPPPPMETPSAAFETPVPEETKSLFTWAPVSPWLAALAWSAAWLLTMLGWQLRRASTFGAALRQEAEDARDARDQALRDRGAAERERLEEAWADAGSPPLHLFDAPAAPGLPDRDVQDSALVLGRIARWSGGADLDVEATTDRAVRESGFVAPVMYPRPVVLRTVVLIDLDVEDHPWKGRFLRLVQAWERTGAPVDAWVFRHHNPDVVYRPGSNQRVAIGDLARRTEGQPLLLLSSDPHPAGHDGLRVWVDALPGWSRVAWCDPDPRPAAAARGERAAWLGEHTVRRFPFNAGGVKAAVQHLAGIDRPVAVAWAADPALPDAHEAWLRWALAAAHVPDPTWDQLEVFRRQLPEVAEWFTEPDHVAFLVDWVARQPESHGRGVRERGEGLYVSDALEDRLEKHARRRAASDPSWTAYARRVDDILLGQLSHAAPEDQDSWQYAWWLLKVKWIEARRDPACAAALAALHGGPLDETVRWMVDRELAVQRACPVVGVDWELPATPGQASVQIPVQRWVWPVRVPAGLAAAALALGWLAIGVVGGGETVPAMRRLVWPATERVVVLAPRREEPKPVVVPLPPSAPPPPREEQTMAAPNPPMIASLPGGVVPLPAPPPSSEASSAQGAATPRYKPGRVRMVEIPAGSFWMGSPTSEDGRDSDEARHSVTLTRPFLLATTEVTQGLYREVMGSLQECPVGTRQPGDTLPMHCVSWDDAVAFAEKLSALDGLPEGQAYRLPTEAEWEYATRAGTELVWAGTSDETALCALANVARCEGRSGLMPVGQLRANHWGLHDMTGNVREWTADWYGAYGGDAVDPRGPRLGSLRVDRGGSFRSEPAVARAAVRYGDYPSRRSDSQGFRLARSLPPGLSPSDPPPAPEDE